jgi:hypothetical protein
MDRIFALLEEAVTRSADTVGQAADERMRRDGPVEAPNEHSDRAAALRRRLHAARDSVAASGAAAALDASVHDASVHDASVHDASVHDAAVHDAAVHDASVHDASVHAAAILLLAREVVGGVWETLWDDIVNGVYESVYEGVYESVSTARGAAADHIRRNRDTYLRRGGSWVWGALGRSLGVATPARAGAY